MFLSEKQKKLIESVAKINNIARVSVWLFNKEKDMIRSEAIYSLHKNKYLPGISLHKKDFPTYFKALETQEIIAAHDAVNDERTAEFRASYLNHLGITSMLDVPISSNGELAGVICHEHTGEKRTWTEQEIFFAQTIAGLFENTLEEESREKLYMALQASEERFRSIAEKTNIIPWTTDAGMSRISYVGPQAERVLGYPIHKWYEKNFWPDHIHPDDKERIMQEAFEAQKLSQNYDHEYRMIAADGSILWFRDVVNVERVDNELKMLRGYLINITEQKKADEKIQKLNTDLEERVQERTAQLLASNMALERAKTSAEESRTAKELFLANMSHEIRTPLNAIIGFQQLLKESPLNEEQLEYINSIDFASRNLLVIINDILDLSKIEAGKFQFDEGEFNIRNTVKSVVELMELRAREKKLALSISQDPGIPEMLYFDATRLSQILLNLVGNAIKFTEKGEVKISTHLLEESEDSILCEFAVEDTGIGISKEMLMGIFERFTQESVETTRRYGGTGLGLTISRYLVEMQGGTIQAHSTKGKGSVFSFQLKFKKVLNRKTELNTQKPEEFIVTQPLRKLNILLAEDVLLNQRLVVKIMEKWHHNLDIAENGKIAVEKVQQNNYDLILMDIQMPEMDGYEATTIIRNLADERLHSIPIVALTAEASSSEAEKCINLGMNSYIAKPFSQQKLQQVIAQLIR